MKIKYKTSFREAISSLQQLTRTLDTSGYARKKYSAASLIGFISASHELADKLPPHDVHAWRQSDTGYYAITVSFSPSYTFDIVFANSAQPFYKTMRKTPTIGQTNDQSAKSAGYSKISTVHNVLMKYVKDNDLQNRERVVKNV